MENFKYALDGAWQVLLVGVVLGAGLPAVFALGIRSLALGSAGVTVEGQADHQASALGKVLAGICFAVVLAAVAVGITLIVATGFGKEVSFDHVYPTIHAK